MVRFSPFERLGAPAVLWYFLTLLLVAATVMNARIELEMLAVLTALLAACGGRHALGALPGGLAAGGSVGALTLLLHSQGRPLLRLGPLVATGEGVHWAVCLGVGMVIIVVCASLQTVALRRLRLVPGLPRFAQRTALVCAMAISLIPAIASRLSTLVALSQEGPGARRRWLPRLRVLAYAILAETLEDASNRASTLALLGPLPSGARPARRVAAPASTRARALRSTLLALSATLLAALTLLPEGSPAHLAFAPDAAAILLAALPLLVEGGGRLWSRLRA